MKLAPPYIAGLALALALNGAALGDDALRQASPSPETATQFARIAKNERGLPAALQLAIVTYVPQSGGDRFSVDLVSAVHIGDKAYFAELNDRFRDYDALLYELIAPPEARASVQSAERTGLLSGSQLALTQALGLSFQLDEIDYGRPNFVHADLSPDELSQSMAERGESLYVYFWRIFYASVDEYVRDPLGVRDWRLLMALFSTDSDNALKIALAYEMTRIDRVRDALDGASGSAVIGSRNARAIDVLRERLDLGSRRIGIFYGAAHMPDLEDRLVEDLNLMKEKTAWIDAWDLDGGAAGRDRR